MACFAALGLILFALAASVLGEKLSPQDSHTRSVLVPESWLLCEIARMCANAGDIPWLNKSICMKMFYFYLEFVCWCDRDENPRTTASGAGWHLFAFCFVWFCSVLWSLLPAVLIEAECADFRQPTHKSRQRISLPAPKSQIPTPYVL